VTQGDCDLVLQDCPNNLTCRVQSVDGGSPRAACLDLGNGSADLGGACTAHTQCRAGLVCALNKCTRPCCIDQEAALCAHGDCDLTVTFPGGAFTRVCTFSPPCTPWANDCPPGIESDCHAFANEFECSFPRYSPDAGSTVGQPCVYVNDCGDSQYCLYPSGTATSGICRWLCKVSNTGAPDAGTVGGSPGQGGCEPQETCLAFTSPSWLGVCRP
jgi:hypothetical protein